MRTARQLRIAVAGCLAYNVLATLLAVWQNWASQFGIVGTDAAKEWPINGTAISAPVLPLVILLVSLPLLFVRSRVRWLGDLLVVLTAILFTIGGLGEILAEPTDVTPRAVLLPGGVIAIILAVLLAGLAVRDAVAAWRQSEDDGRPSQIVG